MIERLGRTEVDELLETQVVGRIGCHAGGETYVVPVVFAFDGEHIHVASVEGRKVRMMRRNPRVCFEVDEHDPTSGRWRSVIAHGVYEEVEGDDAERTLALLGERFARPDGERRPRLTTRETVFFRIRIVERSE